MPPTSRTTQSMVNQILTYVGIDSSKATSDQRSTALGWINEAYRVYLRGVWYDTGGERNLHLWSFMTETDDLTITTDDADIDMPSDFGGLVEDPIFQYGTDGDQGGLNIERRSSTFVLRQQRDSEVTSTPQYWALNHKDHVVASGSLYEMLLSPTPDADLTASLVYLVDPADLTDSATVYPKGNMGCELLIVQIAKAAREGVEGDVYGPEMRKSRELMADLVLADMQNYATAEMQDSYADIDSGIS